MTINTDWLKLSGFWLDSDFSMKGMFHKFLWIWGGGSKGPWRALGDQLQKPDLNGTQG